MDIRINQMDGQEVIKRRRGQESGKMRKWREEENTLTKVRKIKRRNKKASENYKYA